MELAGASGLRCVWRNGAACSFPGENARSWEALGEARPGQSSLSAGALPFVPSKRLPDWAFLELSPSVESCGCGLGPSPVRLG